MLFVLRNPIQIAFEDPPVLHKANTAPQLHALQVGSSELSINNY